MKNTSSKQHFVILGGGIAGLATAKELLKRGQQVTVIEKGQMVGGLARTFQQDGFRFDIGGHRFHSNNLAVVQWVKDLLKADLLTVPRISHIHLEGQFVNYPLQFPQSLSIFSPMQALQMGSSYLMAKIARNGHADVSFEDWVVKRFGRAMYSVFFEPYTQKVWGINCNQLSAAWASQRIGIPSMWQALKEVFIPSKNTLGTTITSFYYPRQGFGMIAQALAADIETEGGKIYTHTVLHQLEPLATGGFKVVVADDKGNTNTLNADKLVSTIPLNALLQAIPSNFDSQKILNAFSLDYRDLICLFIALNKKQVSKDSWTYFPNKNLIFGRTHEPKNWSVEMVPDDSYTSLAVEIYASRGEAVWHTSDEAILDKVVAQMDDIGWIKQKDIYKSWVLRVPYAYPIYRVGYEEKLQAVKNYLAQWPDLYLVGRTGSFKYMNSDGVIEDVFGFIKKVFGDDIAPKTLVVDEGRWV